MGLIRSKGIQLGVLILCSVFVIVLGLFSLRAGTQVIRAEGPVFSIAAAWPPIPMNLSAGGEARAKAVFSGASDDGLLVAWKEGSTNPDGSLWCRWNDGSGWQDRTRIDNTAGFEMFSADAALDGTNAYFVWSTINDSDPENPTYQVYYRSWNLAGMVLGATEKVRDTGNKLGDVQIAFAGGTPHVVWVEKTDVGTMSLDRIYYADRSGPNSWAAPRRISGGCVGGTCEDRNFFEEDMPVMHAEGNELYVAWREKSSDPGYPPGIFFRHLDSVSGWQPPDSTDPLGQRLSDDAGDAAPTLDAAQDRVYVAWERYGGPQWAPEGTYEEGRHFGVYTLTYRVWMDTSNVFTNWEPNIDLGAQAVIRESGLVVTATSSLTLTADSSDPYLWGAHPDIQVVYASGMYTPYISWQTWVHDFDKAPDPPKSGNSFPVNSTYPMKVGLLFAYDGGVPGSGIGEDQLWDSVEATSPAWQEYVLYAGSDRVFSSPLLALTEGVQGGYDLHIVMSAQSGQGWSVYYTNPYQYYWVYLPLVLRSSP